jgi:peptide/nickel transport system substrate-binding protein
VATSEGTRPALDALIDKARIESDLTKRDAHMHDALSLLNRDIPLLPLHQSVIPWAMKKNVTAKFPPNSVPYFFRFRID